MAIEIAGLLRHAGLSVAAFVLAAGPLVSLPGLALAASRHPGSIGTGKGQVAARSLAPLVLAQAKSVQPIITTAKRVVAGPDGEALIAIDIGPADAVPKGSFVRIKGLASKIELTEGFAVSPGLWAVPLNALGKLRAKLPAGSKGEAQLNISLATVDGGTLAEATVVFVAAVDATSAAGARNSSAQTPAAAKVPGATGSIESVRTPKAEPLLPADRERALGFIARGDALMAEGNISGARLFYQRSADAGLAQGAIALASTYDPAELARLNVRGLTADRAVAKRWYERARALGAAEADERLQRLSAR